MSTLAIELCERGWLPDWLTRLGMRRLMAQRIADETAGSGAAALARYQALLDELRQSRIAIETAAANEQHYELPAAFFEQVLGAHLKYSSGWWDDGVTALDQAEARMLQLSCERAQLADGQEILELGCGWGSLTLWMARHYPGARITAVSNSASQREYIMQRCRRDGLRNVDVITADANTFATGKKFDRVVSVEMFEHMRNYEQLMQRISGWLVPGGKLFVHIFCHRTLMYPFTTGDKYDWMSRYFFTGGLMPSEHTLLHFQQHLRIEEQWRVAGTHYEKTANAWLARLDSRRAQALAVLADAYGQVEAERWLQRWRMFFMAVSELFGYRNGQEWFVSHYRFSKPAG